MILENDMAWAVTRISEPYLGNGYHADLMDAIEMIRDRSLSEGIMDYLT
jgi:hypothetical protein